MHLVSVQVGTESSLQVGARTVRTGIDKHPVSKAEVTKAGVQGDHIVDARHHGGPDQAVYLYSAEDHEWWRRRLGRPVRPGEFGENLTVSSFGPNQPRIGDRYRIGESLVVELTAPRIPCAVLGAQMGDGGFAEVLRDSGRPGAYARVLTAGWVSAGDTITQLHSSVDAPGVVEVFQLYYERAPGRGALERILSAPVAERTRQLFADRLARID